MYEGGTVRINLDWIRISAGGEKLDAVIGGAEEEELSSFEPGAFKMMEDQDDGSGKIATMDLRKWNWKKMCREMQENGVLRGSSPLLPSRWNENHQTLE
ncbi:hypothetical protein MRB53_018176 [Persea americana]|uniref:Uncharacterized protein n=1 Tax=Persea americana TaxID=3435 RepID=A0ACC2M759_PERAE|nr:hypothetical protein MRB53_018176 [Persea americana]